MNLLSALRKKKHLWRSHAKFKGNDMYVKTTQQSAFLNTVLATYLVRVQTGI